MKHRYHKKRKDTDDLFWITGHKGFIGSKFVNYSNKKGQSLMKFSRENIIEKNKILKTKKNIKNLNLNNYKKYRNFFFHFAQYYNINPKNFIDQKKIILDNLYFGINTLNFFDQNYFDKIISLQSCVEFYKKNNNLYSLSKTLFSQYCTQKYKNYCKIYLYDTFGSNDSRGNLIEIWINNLLLNKPINIYSNNTMVNLTNADFIAKTLFNIDKIPPGNYSLRSDVTITLIELALFLKKLTNSKSKIINLKKNKAELIFKYDNISQVLEKNYDFNDFQVDIKKIIKIKSKEISKLK